MTLKQCVECNNEFYNPEVLISRCGACRTLETYDQRIERFIAEEKNAKLKIKRLQNGNTKNTSL